MSPDAVLLAKKIISPRRNPMILRITSSQLLLFFSALPERLPAIDTNRKQDL